MKLYFQYRIQQRVVIYLVVSGFIGLVAIAIATFHPTSLIVKILVGMAYFLSFGLSSVVVSESRIAYLNWKKRSDHHLAYIELWLVGLAIFIIGFFLLGGIQNFIGNMQIAETSFYFEPDNGFMPFSLQFLGKMIIPWIIDVLLVGHVVLKKALPGPEIESKTEEKAVTIKAGKNLVTLNPENISHISVIQHYATLYLNTVAGFDEIELKTSLVNILKQLPADRFIQVHRSHLVNLDYIERIENKSGETSVLIKNRKKFIPVSRRQSRDFKKVYNSHREQQRKITAQPAN